MIKGNKPLPQAIKAIKSCEELYLDYFNNFITIQRFAEYHNLPLEIAKAVIKSGMYYNHNQEEWK